MHAGDKPARADSVIAEARAFMDRIHSAMGSSPQPPVNHPYWIGAVAGAERLTAMRHAKANANAAGAPDDSWAQQVIAARARVPLLEKVLREVFRIAIGIPPRVNCAHYDWLDYRKVMPDIDRALAQSSARILYVAAGFNPFDRIFADVASRCQRVDVMDWLASEVPASARPTGTFDFCFIYLSANLSIYTAQLAASAEAAMRPGAQILIMLHDDTFERVSSTFSATLLQNTRGVLPRGTVLRHIQFTGGLMKAIVRDAILRRVDRILRRGPMRAVGSILSLSGLMIMMLAINIRTALRKDDVVSRHCSSLILDVRADPEAAIEGTRHP